MIYKYLDWSHNFNVKNHICTSKLRKTNDDFSLHDPAKNSHGSTNAARLWWKLHSACKIMSTLMRFFLLIPWVCSVGCITRKKLFVLFNYLMVLNGRYFFQGSIFGQHLEIMLKITPKMFPIDQI